MSQPVPERHPFRFLEAPRCHLGEGPTYDAASDTLWWFDILERRLFEAPRSGGAARIHELPLLASAMGFVDDGRQLLATESGFFLRDLRDGRLSLLAPLEADDAGTRSNDGRVHPSGTFWVGTMSKTAKAGAGAIYALAQGEVHKLFSSITIPNSICFSPDGATGYFCDTRAKVLNRVALDPATGLPAGDPSPLVLHSGAGGLDGAVTDAQGLIWCAMWGAARINVYSPHGELVRAIETPARQTSCPVFAGPDFSRLFCTSAFEHMDEAARASDPEHGRAFVIEIGGRGRAEPRVTLGA